MRSGDVAAVVTSTSLELGVDIGTADIAVQIGLPGSVARCVQRAWAGRAIAATLLRGLLLAATPAELVGAIITARTASRRSGRAAPYDRVAS